MVIFILYQLRKLKNPTMGITELQEQCEIMLILCALELCKVEFLSMKGLFSFFN